MLRRFDWVTIISVCWPEGKYSPRGGKTSSAVEIPAGDALTTSANPPHAGRLPGIPATPPRVRMAIAHSSINRIAAKRLT